MSGKNKSEKPNFKVYPYHVSTLHGKKSLCISEDYWKNNAVFLTLGVGLAIKEIKSSTKTTTHFTIHNINGSKTNTKSSNETLMLWAINVRIYHQEQKFKEAKNDIYINIGEVLSHIETKHSLNLNTSHKCNKNFMFNASNLKSTPTGVIYKYSDIIHIPAAAEDPKNIFRFDRTNAEKKYLRVVHNGKPNDIKEVKLQFNRKCCNFSANVSLTLSLHSMSSEELNKLFVPYQTKK